MLVPGGSRPVTPPGLPNELEADVEEGGLFRFEVPPGQYRLAAKPLGETDLVYYPKVLVLEDALRPDGGTHETQIEFRLPKRPEQVQETPVRIPLPAESKGCR
jgi:hypothetical protein